MEGVGAIWNLQEEQGLGTVLNPECFLSRVWNKQMVEVRIHGLCSRNKDLLSLDEAQRTL
jgi:hypothetical protein